MNNVLYRYHQVPLLENEEAPPNIRKDNKIKILVVLVTIMFAIVTLMKVLYFTIVTPSLRNGLWRAFIYQINSPLLFSPLLSSPLPPVLLSHYSGLAFTDAVEI